MLSPHAVVPLLLGVLLCGLFMTIVAKYSSKRPFALAEQAPEETKLKTPESKLSMKPTPLPPPPADPRPSTMPVAPAEDIDSFAAKQSFDAFLVLDVEATCLPGTNFDYANEIIVRSSLAPSQRDLTWSSAICRSGQCVCYDGSTRIQRAGRADWRSSTSSGVSCGQYGDHNYRRSVQTSLA